MWQRALFSAVFFFLSVHATTFDVNTTTDFSDLNCSDGSCSLRDAIALCEHNDTITFSVVGRLELQDEINISKSITIQGPASTLLTLTSGNDTSRLFYIQSDSDEDLNVTLKELNFADSYLEPGYGAVIYLAPHNHLNVEHCVFRNNTALESAGAIYHAGDSLHITHSRFVDNHSQSLNAGAIYTESGQLTITNSTFTQNSAAFQGGALFNEFGSLAILDSNLTYNRSLQNQGGAITSLQGKMTLSKSLLEGNRATQGAALYCRECAITSQSNQILSNHASDTGGALLLLDSSLDSESDIFLKNHALSGGAILSENTRLSISKAFFNDNDADQAGGAIALHGVGDIQIKHSVFQNNLAVSGGALASDQNSSRAKVGIENSLFSQNNAEQSGGALQWSSSEGALDIRFSTFMYNRSEQGGGIHSLSPTLSLYATVMSDNNATEGNDCMGTVSSKNYNLISLPEMCEIRDEGSQDILHQNAMLEPLDINTTFLFAPSKKSPLIDKVPCEKEESDLIGTPRPQSGECDIGAMEFTPTPTLTHTLYQGWNLISLPTLMELDTKAMRTLFASPDVKHIYKYDSIFSNWKTWQRNDLKVANSFTQLSTKDPIWVEVSNDTNLSYYLDEETLAKTDLQDDPEKTSTLFGEWTLAGFYKDISASALVEMVEARRVNKALGKQVAYMLKFNNKTKQWEYFSPGPVEESLYQTRSLPTLGKYLQSTPDAPPQIEKPTSLKRFFDISRHEAVWIRSK